MKNGNLQTWALIAEIIGGIAVVFSLIFVGLEIRQSSEAAKTATYDSLVSDVADWYLTTATDEDVRETIRIRQSQGPNARSEEQEFLDRRVSISLWMIYERAFLQWESEYMDNSQFERFRYQICREQVPEFEESIWPNITGVTSRSFVEFRENCRSINMK